MQRSKSDTCLDALQPEFKVSLRLVFIAFAGHFDSLPPRSLATYLFAVHRTAIDNVYNPLTPLAQIHRISRGRSENAFKTLAARKATAG